MKPYKDLTLYLWCETALILRQHGLMASALPVFTGEKYPLKSAGAVFTEAVKWASRADWERCCFPQQMLQVQISILPK